MKKVLLTMMLAMVLALGFACSAFTRLCAVVYSRIDGEVQGG